MQKHRSISIFFGILFVLAIMDSATNLAAEPTSDPNHPVYRALDRWQTRGLVGRLPVIQPYPQSELERLLADVIQRGTPQESAQAEQYLQEISPRTEGAWGYASPYVEARAFTRDDEIQPKGAIGVDFAGRLTDTISIGGSAGGYAIERDDADLVPYGERSRDDVVDDNAKVTVRGRDIYTLLQVNTQTTFEWENAWLQAGIYRRSFGPNNDDSPVISRYAPQSGNITVQYDIGPVRYTGALSSHTATSPFRTIEELGNNDNVDVNQDGTEDFEARAKEEPGKHLFIHSFGIRPTDWIEFSIFEAVVFGPRLEPAYLVPLKFMWHAQSTAAFSDNSLIGATLDLRPATNVRIPLTIYVDDASFNDLARLNFDTKYKMATASAIQWAPRVMGNPMVELSYETVFPYMYSHAELDPYTTEANYNNYLHQNTSIGSGLLPNSDRAKLTVDLAPIPTVDLSIFGALIRHANASEGELDQYLNDGGYYDNGREGEFFEDPNTGALEWSRGDLTYNETFGFLTQDHVERRYQAGISGTARLPIGRSRVRIGGGYTFEYVQKPIVYVWSQAADEDGGGGVTRYANDQTNHYVEVDLRYSY